MGNFDGYVVVLNNQEMTFFDRNTMFFEVDGLEAGVEYDFGVYTYVGPQDASVWSDLGPTEFIPLGKANLFLLYLRFLLWICWMLKRNYHTEWVHCFHLAYCMEPPYRWQIMCSRCPLEQHLNVGHSTSNVGLNLVPIFASFGQTQRHYAIACAVLLTNTKQLNIDQSVRDMISKDCFVEVLHVTS